nr:N66 matrix protein-like isoform X2 [Parasteatoda tepidariorum]
MNTFLKICLMVFVVAILTACSEAQYNGYNGAARGGRGFGGRPVNQGNQGGDTSQGNNQDGYNVNYGQGDLNNNQRNQGSQQGFQRNLNGGYY